MCIFWTSYKFSTIIYDLHKSVYIMILSYHMTNSSCTDSDPVSFNTPNNINYDYFVYDNITIVCDIQDYVEFQWQFSDNSVIPFNNEKFQYIETNLLIKSLSLSDSGAYYCLANNQVTTIEKLRANLNVFSKCR